MADQAELAVRLSLDNQFSRGIANASRSLGKFEGDIRKVSRGTGQLAKGAVRAGAIVGTAVVGGLALAAREAINFEDAFAGVVKTVDEADLKSAGLTFDELSASIRKLSTEMPNSAIELAGIAEQAGALGIKAKDIEAFTKQVAILASTTDVSADDAATALGQLQNVIGLTGDEFDNFAATLVDLGNKGASTESQILEIARRAGASAKLIGVAKDETLGWASAAANLGLEQELAGTSLQRFYLQMQSLASGKGLPKLAKVAGVTAKDFKTAFKKDASGAMEQFLKGLGKLPKDARLKTVQDLFGKGSGLTRLILGLSDSIDKNLDPSLRTSTDAWKKATAAQIEFDKRNKTVRSSISRFRNVLIDAAVTLGEGMAPAIGRAADKLSDFLKQDSNRQQLKDLGRDIGAFIDGINWQEVIDGGKTILSVLKTAGDMGLRLLGIISKLPKELLAVGGGALVLNKLSGGLLGAGAGNILGGLGGALAKSLAASIPVFGKAFVQPVFVTNMGAGFGAPGGGGGPGSSVGLLGLIGPAAIAALGAKAAADFTNAEFTNAGFDKPDFQAPGTGDPFGISSAIHNLQEVVRLATQNPRATKGNIDRPSTVGPAADAQRKAIEAVQTQVEKLKASSAADLGKTNAKLATIDNSARLSAERTSGVKTQVSTAQSAIVGAIIRSRPVVNITIPISPVNITRTTTVVKRYGPTGGSRNTQHGPTEFDA